MLHDSTEYSSRGGMAEAVSEVVKARLQLASEPHLYLKPCDYR